MLLWYITGKFVAPNKPVQNDENIKRTLHNNITDKFSFVPSMMCTLSFITIKLLQAYVNQGTINNNKYKN